MYCLVQFIDKLLGFDSAVETQLMLKQRVENGVGAVKLMGRYRGKLSITNQNYNRYFETRFIRNNVL